MEDLAQVRARYEAAVNGLTEKLKRTPNVIAVILMGSLSYDTVWEKSDVDMMVVVKDVKSDNHGFCLDVDGINVNADVVTLSMFRRSLESESGGSIDHSFTAKGKILYTIDETLYEFFDDFRKIGADDMSKSLFYMCGELIGLNEKTHKWIEVKHDLTYAQLYVLKMSEAAARMEVCRNREPPTREVVLRACELNPELFERLYKYPLSHILTEAELNDCCNRVDAYLTEMLDLMTLPLRSVMTEGELMTLGELTRVLKSGSHYLVHILDYFAEKGILMRVTREIKLFPHSKKEFDEVAYILM